MRSAAALTAGPGGRIERMVDAAPVAWRPTAAGVYLVGTAAAPVGDDDLRIAVDVQAGATLAVRSAAATVLWHGHGSHQQIDVHVADGGSLDWHLEPVIASRGCDHCQEVRVRLDGSARLRWHEQLVFGRIGEQPGRVDLRLDVVWSGRPLLRHSLLIDPESGDWTSPAVLARRRVVGFVLDVDPDDDPRAACRQPASGSGRASMALEGPAVLTQAVADDLRSLQDRLVLCQGDDSGVG